jgi:hypothetical protein
MPEGNEIASHLHDTSASQAAASRSLKLDPRRRRNRCHLAPTGRDAAALWVVFAWLRRLVPKGVLLAPLAAIDVVRHEVTLLLPLTASLKAWKLGVSVLAGLASDYRSRSAL